MFKNKEYVLTVYREGGFTKAAEKLFISQPSLSASIKRIEEKLSAPIFDRATSPIGLTEVGREYVKYALEIEQKEKDFERYVSDHTNLLAGKIRIGGSSFFSSYLIPKMVYDFNLKHPKIEFEIFEDSTKNLMNKLSSGVLDIIIDNANIKDDNIISKVYTSERLLLAVPKRFKINETLSKHRFTSDMIKRGEHEKDIGVSIADFKDLPFILLNPENDTGKRAASIFKRHKITPNVIFHLDQQVTAYNVTCTGMGISFVSDTLVKHSSSEHDIYFYKLSDRDSSRNIYFYQKSHRYLSVACKKFIEYNSPEK